MDYVLKTNSLCKHYKDYKALNSLTMNVPKGSIYGFVGKNGAGKTTLIRLVCGLQLPTSGDFELYGVKHSDKAISKSRRRMGAVVETPSIYLDMTAEDNLKQQYRILGMPSFDGISELLKLVGLENTGRKRAKNFSLGMRQRLGLAQAIMEDPKLLILDEPFNGIDLLARDEIRGAILSAAVPEKLLLLSSHLVEEMEAIADRAVFIRSGVLIEVRDLEEMREVDGVSMADRYRAIFGHGEVQA